VNFVSSRAKVKGFFEGENVVLGPSMIGLGSVLGRNVIVGYPQRKTIQAFDFSKGFSITKFDRVSRGAKIGRGCIIRSGTVVYENVSIGNWVETGHNVLIREGTVVGDRTHIGSATQLDGAVRVGRNVSIQSNVYLPHLTVVGDDVFLAPNVVFTNDPYPVCKRLVGVVVERGAVVGANSCIIAGAKIGKGAVVTAGAVVTKDVPSNAVAMGVPAKVYTTRDEYEKKKTKWEHK